MENSTHQKEALKHIQVIKSTNKKAYLSQQKDDDKHSLNKFENMVQLCATTLQIYNQFKPNKKVIIEHIKTLTSSKEYFPFFMMHFIGSTYANTQIKAHKSAALQFEKYTIDELKQFCLDIDSYDFVKVKNHIIKLEKGEQETSETDENQDTQKPMGERKNDQKKAISKVSEKIFGAEFVDDATLQVLIHMMKKYDESKFDSLIKKGKSEVYSK